MPGSTETLNNKLGLDTSDFKTGLATANRELRSLESGFRASVSTLDDWAKSVTGLEARQKSLTAQIDIQKAKVQALRDEYDKQTKAHGEMSIASQNAEIKLNQETERLGKMEEELKNTYPALDQVKAGQDSVGKSADDMGKKAEENAKKMETFKAVLVGVGTVALAAATAVIAAGAAVAGVMIKMVFDAGKLGDKYSAMSLVTGISTEHLQEMAYVGKLVDVELETMTGSITKLTKAMWAAKDGTGAQALAFKSLKVDILDTNGKLRDQESVFWDVINALGQVENPAERDALAMAVLGKSAMELNPLIKAGSGEIARLSQEAHKLGGVIEDDDIQALDKFQDQWEGLSLVWESIKASIAVNLLGPFTALEDYLKGFIANTLVPAITHFGEFASLELGIQPKKPATAVPATDFSKLSQEQINWMWVQYWNGNGPKPPEGSQYTGGKGTPVNVADATSIPTTGKFADVTEIPFQLTPFEAAVKGFVDTLKATDWKSIGDNLANFAKQMINVDWKKIGTDMINLAKNMNDFAAMLQPWGDKNPFIQAADDFSKFVNSLIESINKLFALFGATGITPLIKPTLKIPAGAGNPDLKIPGTDYLAAAMQTALTGLTGNYSFSASASQAQAPVNIYFSPVINNALDAEAIAYQVAAIVQRRH